ncbi:hypothetical protein H6G89_07050 [Oscillatoria sp. FACHB-1407]|uniref:hypothetical protein n=1 Tax=Oscillatoria sp. FACHB-1407 TaxID=2692847 RepID=UPI001688DB13|nr:hypothetical protein [Oscillatoria sp. FACHB-1407]MBD2460798.1 hypothetical protein [Oscillatoria sp. FACHB-1407]
MILTVDLQSDSAAPTDTSELGVIDMQTDSFVEGSLQPAVPAPPLFNAAAIRQTLIQLVDVAQPATMAATPETVLGAMQRLVDVIGELRSPHSGWSADLPQTPENLFPYVTEEAYDLLDALQQQSIQPTPHATDATPAIAQFLQQDYCSITDLTPWLLWAIARSSYEVMQLMEGVEVQIAQPDQEWQTGILRLAIALQFDSPDLNWALDLVTLQPCQPHLSPDAQIQSTTLSPSSPLVAGELVQQVMQQIQRATPVLCPFVTGIQTTLLMPQDDWQAGLLQLQFGLEFMPTVGTSKSSQDTALNSSSATPDEQTDSPESEPPVPSSSTNSLKPLIQFTDTNWSSQYSAIVNQQHLDAILTHLQTSRTHDAVHLSPTSSIADVVEAGLIITNQLHQSSTLASRNIPHQIWGLSQLNLRLLWCVSRGAHEIMQLMAGIAAQVLQPTQSWQTGTLRLAVNLKLQTPELDWQLDLVTGRTSPVNSQFLAEDAIAQSHQTQWCQHPTLVQRLTHQVMHDIQHATPEIQLLLDGTDINLQQGDEPWQPGTLQLITGFEFVPDRPAV